MIILSPRSTRSRCKLILCGSKETKETGRRIVGESSGSTGYLYIIYLFIDWIKMCQIKLENKSWLF